MEPSDHVLADLHWRAGQHPEVADRLLEMAREIESHLADDARAKMAALGLLGVCVECGGATDEQGRCDLCHPPFDPLPES